MTILLPDADRFARADGARRREAGAGRSAALSQLSTRRHHRLARRRARSTWSSRSPPRCSSSSSASSAAISARRARDWLRAGDADDGDPAQPPARPLQSAADSAARRIARHQAPAPADLALAYVKVSRYGILVLVGLMYFGQPILAWWLSPSQSIAAVPRAHRLPVLPRRRVTAPSAVRGRRLPRLRRRAGAVLRPARPAPLAHPRREGRHLRHPDRAHLRAVRRAHARRSG